MAAGDTSFPFDNGDANEPEFRKLFEPLGDGIVNDPTQTAFGVTVNTATQEVTIGPGRARVAGAMLDATLPQPFGLTSGPQPGVGQGRIDRVVVRCDYAGDVVQRHLIVGTPAASPTIPPVSADPTGLWDLPLRRIVRTVTGAGVTISTVDERRWVGPGGFLLATGAPFPPVIIGGHLRVGASSYFGRVVEGAPAWAQVPDVPPSPTTVELAAELGFDMRTGTGTYRIRSIRQGDGVVQFTGRLLASSARPAGSVLARVALPHRGGLQFVWLYDADANRMRGGEISSIGQLTCKDNLPSTADLYLSHTYHP